MKFTLSNYEHLLNHPFYEANKKLINHKPLHSITIDQIVELINENKILNNTNNVTTDIIFENFSSVNKFLTSNSNKIKHTLNHFFKTELDIDEQKAIYNNNDKNIVLRENLLFKESHINHSFNKHFLEKLNLNDYLNYVVLHEIGHSLHHQYYLENEKHLAIANNSTHFLNDSVLLYMMVKLEEGNQYRKTDLNQVNFHAVTEGLADMYACIAISQIYPKEESITFIKHIIECRKEADKINEFYYTQNSIEDYLNDFINCNVKFNNFNDVYKYMSVVISKTVENLMTQQLRSSNDKDIYLNNSFLGFINSQLNLNCNNADEVIKKINEKYDFNFSCIPLHSFHFEKGHSKYQEYVTYMSKNESGKKIATLRERNDNKTLLFKNSNNF